MILVHRVRTGRELGQGRRRLDLLLGSAALLPVVGAGLDVWIDSSDVTFVGPLAILWSGALLAFFAGVRRGLTFSEVEGGRPWEIVTLLWLFAVAMATLVFNSAIAGIVGFLSVGLLDAIAADADEAPPYFRIFRPLQMVVAAAGLGSILTRALTLGAA